MMPNNERVNGLVMGAMAGECIGSPYLYMKADALFAMARQLQWKIGVPGECMHLMATSLSGIARRGVRIDIIANGYRRWVGTGHDASYVMTECFGDRSKHAHAFRDHAEDTDYGTLCSNLLLIRQIPLVIAGLFWDDHTLCGWIREECSLTHRDESCIGYAWLYALCLRDILLGKSRAEIWDHLFEIPVSREVRRTLLCSYFEMPLCDGKDYSHAGIAFGMALYHFWHDTPVFSAIRSAVLAGGSTDVNGCAAGALMGAWQGLKSIPVSWRNVMEHAPNHGYTDIIPEIQKDVERILKRSNAYICPSPDTINRPRIHVHPKKRNFPSIKRA